MVVIKEGGPDQAHPSQVAHRLQKVARRHALNPTMPAYADMR